ncbi:MAG: hypothetical protein AAGF26_00910 [Cyanobacteria bacterium P01_G01_bin.49]
METQQYENIISAINELKVDIDQRFEQVDKRFEQVDERFKEIDNRFEKVEITVKAFNDAYKQVVNLSFALIASATVAVIVKIALN